MRFWQRDRGLRRLEAELRAARHEAPREFTRTLVQREPRWLRPRLRIGAAVALGALALTAMASAGGMGVIKEGTTAAVDVIKRTTDESAPRQVLASSAGEQYEQRCGGINEIPCTITIYDASVREGDTGEITLMVFTLSLDATPTAPVTVNYSTSDVTATGGTACVEGVDYIIQSGTVVFPSGVASQEITVQVCGDSILEADESFYVNLFGQSPNSKIYRGRATGRIVNDDRR